MPRVGRTSLIVFLLILGIGVLPATRTLYGQSDPEWYKTYLAGLDKVKAKDYKGAIVLLRKAISEHPSSAVSPRYTPYFYVGLCYDVTGDKDSAADFYTQEDQQKAIRAFPEDRVILLENFDRIQSAEDFGVIVIDRTKPAKKAQSEAGQKPTNITATNEASAKEAGTSTGSPAVGATTATTKPPVISTTGSAPPPKAAPECDLKRCLTRFLSGNYQAALKESEPIIRKNCPEKRAALFIAGASHYSLFLLSGESDVKAKGEADRLFAACAGYQPPRQWVSPSVLSYYQQVSARRR